MKLLIAAAAMLLSTGASAPQQLQTAVLAGGCFWGVEAVFEHVKGVREVVSGYAGGSRADATYAKVSSERTPHAEAVRIRFDPRQVSYGDLLRIYFAVAHDPTQLNRQGPDVGRSYRSAIFPQNAQQRIAATQAITQLKRSHKIATRIETGAFYPAEAHHQDFARRNPAHPYILAHDRPKVVKLKRTYPQWWKA
ncbi:MAG: peptide-methionine (S)-S-oxide reductase MsrA [Sphingomicrobium sp.]